MMRYAGRSRGPASEDSARFLLFELAGEEHPLLPGLALLDCGAVALQYRVDEVPLDMV